MNPSASSPCRYKINELRALVEENKDRGKMVAFLAITESWLESYMLNAQIDIPGYALSRCDREGRSGGVCLYTHENFVISDEFRYDDGICQVLVTVMPLNKLCNVVVYRPPDADCTSFNNALTFISEIIEENTDHTYQLCITGDLNLPCVCWKLSSIQNGWPSPMRNSAEIFLKLLSSNMMNQYVEDPTRGQNILDIFCTNNPFLVCNTNVEYTPMSDHKIVNIDLTINATGCTNDRTSKEKCLTGFSAIDFRRADFEKISQRVNDINWNIVRQNSSFEEFPAKFTEILLDICQKSAPKKRPRTGKPKKMNALRRKKRRLESKLDNSRTPEQRRRLERELAMIYYQLKEGYINSKNIEEAAVVSRIKENPKYFFSYAKTHSQIRQDIVMLRDEKGKVTRVPVEISNILQNQFSSVYSNPSSPDIEEPDFPRAEDNALNPECFRIRKSDILAAAQELKTNSTPGPDGVPAELLIRCRDALSTPLIILWEESFSRNIVPQFYKESYVCPIHKKNDRSVAANYRPISLTSHVMKLAERVVRQIIVQHMEGQDLISDKQHGFRTGRSTLSQLLIHFDEVLNGMLEGDSTDTIFLDYSKAFDKVDHRLLLEKMTRYGFPPNLVNWLRSFLSDRTQVVVVKGAHSREGNVVSGVPQGTVLGPILFIVFINDLINKVSECNVSFFADDTRISKQIDAMQSKELLQNDLLSVLSWSKTNNMELNEGKFELQSYNIKPLNIVKELPFQPHLFTYLFSDTVLLEPSTLVKDLGVMVTNDLSWSNHIATIVARARGVASWVLSVFASRERDTVITLYKSMVRSHLEYCCPLWHPSRLSDIVLIESVQREITRKISGLSGLSYWERLKTLGLFSLQRRRERYILICMWKILNGRMPNPNINFRAPSRLGIQAVIPSLSLNRSGSVACQTKFDASFAVVGPRLWNALPSSLTTIQSEDRFKNDLTKLLYELDDMPPVYGYVRAHDLHQLAALCCVWCSSLS